MPMVLTDLDPKAYRFLEKDKIKNGALGGLWTLDPWFFGSTSPYPGDKNEKPATYNAPNVRNKALRTYKFKYLNDKQ